MTQGRIMCVNHSAGPPQVAPRGGLITSQYPAFGSTFHLKPKTYWRMRPITTTGIEIPISTKTIAALSSRDRGRSADSTPIGIASSIQRIAPPKTSEAVTGAA